MYHKLSSMPKPSQELVQILNKLGYGSTFNIPFRNGKPVLPRSGPRIQKNETHPWRATKLTQQTQLHRSYFWLFEKLQNHKRGVVEQLNVWDGRPVKVFIRESK